MIGFIDVLTAARDHEVEAAVDIPCWAGPQGHGRHVISAERGAADAT